MKGTHHENIDKNQRSWDNASSHWQRDYFTKIVQCLMKATGGDGRNFWELTHEEFKAHRKEINDKWSAREVKEGLTYQEFERAVCIRARRILGNEAALICTDTIAKNYKSNPTEEDLHKAARDCAYDTSLYSTRRD